MEDKMEEKDLSIVQKAIGVFFSPNESFQVIDRKPDWIFPLVVIIILTLVFTMITLPYTLPEQMQKQRAKLEERGMADDDIDRAMETGEKMGKIMAPVGVIIGVPIALLLFTLITWFVGNVLLGGQTTFKKMFSVYTYSSLIGTFGLLIRSVIIFVKKTADIHFSLALLLPQEQSETFLYKFLKAFDVFSIWQYAVLAIGFAIIYKFTIKKAGWTMAAMFLIIALISAGLAKIFA
jgi:hypothetical protein